MYYTTSDKKSQVSLETLAKIDRAYLTPAEVAPLLGCDPHLIRLSAKDPVYRQTLGFKVIRVGTRTKIPRVEFLRFMGYTGEIEE